MPHVRHYLVNIAWQKLVIGVPEKSLWRVTFHLGSFRNSATPIPEFCQFYFQSTDGFLFCLPKSRDFALLAAPCAGDLQPPPAPVPRPEAADPPPHRRFFRSQPHAKTSLRSSHPNHPPVASAQVCVGYEGVQADLFMRMKL